MTRQTCVKCGRVRSEAYMRQAVFRDPYWEARDEPVDVWKCSSNESCKQARKRQKAEDSNA